MCSVRHRPMPCAPKARAALRVARVVGVGPHLEAADGIGPAQERGRSCSSSKSRVDGRQLAGEDLAGRAVDARSCRPRGRRPSPTAMVRARVVDLSASQPATHGQAHGAGHDRGVEVAPPRAVRTPRAASMPCTSSGLVSVRTRITGSPAALRLLGAIGVEDRLAGGRARRGVEALGQQSVRGGGLGRLVEAGQEELDDLGRLDAPERLFAGQDPLAHHVDRDLHRGRRRALGRSGLEHVQLAALDGELQVLDVAVVASPGARRSRSNSA